MRRYLEDAQILLKSDTKSLEKFLEEGQTISNWTDGLLNYKAEEYLVYTYLALRTKQQIAFQDYLMCLRKDDQDQYVLAINCIENIEDRATECSFVKLT